MRHALFDRLYRRDVYFKTAYANHNLDRARNQYALVKDMVAKRTEAEAIVKKYL